MRLLFAGTPEVAVPALRRLLDSPHTVVGVLTRPDARAGRGRRSAPSPVRVVAEEAGVPVFTPVTLRDPGIAEMVADLAPDCCPVVAYGNLVPPPLLDLPEHGWLNLHFSLLPAWRGAAPVQHAIMAGDTVTGASVFRLEAGMDTGPVFASLREPIAADDTAGDLLGRLAVAGAELLAHTVDALAAGTAISTAQPVVGVSSAPKLALQDARVDWHQPAEVIDRLIRGCTPAPGGWTTFRGERVKLDPVTVVREASEPPAPAATSDPMEQPHAAPSAGAVQAARADPATPVPEVAGQTSVPVGTLDVTNRRVRVRAGNGWVDLGVVRAAGKKPMPAADWARGARPEQGEVFQ